MALGRDLPSPELGIIRELSQLPQWVAWKTVVASDRKKKLTKVPISPLNGKKASVTNPATWGEYSEAEAFARSTDANGIGFVLSGLEGITVIDLDNVVDPDTLAIAPWAQDVIKAFDTYTEFSPSLTGLHLWLRARPPGNRCRSKSIEMYALKRYITITGNWIGGYEKYAELVHSDEIEKRQDELNQLYDEAFEHIPIAGRLPEREDVGEPGPERDPFEFPLPGQSKWQFEEALYYCRKVMQDGRPRAPIHKIIALQKNDRQFFRIWRKEDLRTQQICGEDQSSWDLAVCNRLFKSELSFTWHEMIGTLIEFREQYDTDVTKLMRADYWARTITRASDRYSEYEEEKKDKAISEKDREAIEKISERFEEADKEERRGLIKDLCDRIGCPDIITITCYPRENDNLYTFHFGEDESQRIEGDIGMLITQTTFRKVVADKARIFIRPMTSKNWEYVAKLLLATVRDEHVPRIATTGAQTLDWLQGYLASQDRPVEFGPDTYLQSGPWWYRGELIMRLSSFESYLRRHRIGISRTEIAKRLRYAGMALRNVSWRVSGRVKGTSFYVIPNDHNFYELARNLPDPVTIIDGKEETS